MVELARSQNEKVIGRNKRLETPPRCTKLKEKKNHGVYCEMFNNSSYFSLHIH
jgi:hypothetical protein